MRYLITGCSGYIGSVLVEKLLQDNHKVVGFDNLLYKQTSLLPFCSNKNFKFIYGDVRNKDVLKECLADVDVIVPLAAIVGAPACDAHPDLAKAVNYEHVKNIMAWKSQQQVVVYTNSNSGYGIGQGSSYCDETSPLLPITYYGITKCDAEKRVLDGNGISLRLATVFGVSGRQRLDLLVNNFTYKALSDGYIVLFEKDFCRNYIHVRDVVNAILFVANKSECQGQVYNVGLSSANLTKYELALKIKEHVPNFSIQCDEYASDKDKRNYLVSNGKIEKLGWQPNYSIDDGIIELKKAFGILFARQQEFTNL